MACEIPKGLQARIHWRYNTKDMVKAAVMLAIGSIRAKFTISVNPTTAAPNMFKIRLAYRLSFQVRHVGNYEDAPAALASAVVQIESVILFGKSRLNLGYFLSKPSREALSKLLPRLEELRIT